ncbi:hypothetical protein N7499_013348 [Penicillium canescens]|nr:hypothetical protein N7499_013348 [Penicillium canescens]
MKNFATTLVTALLAATEGVYAFPSTGTTPLREEASKKDILIGSGAINPTYLNDPKFAAVLANQFNSLSPENEGKWVLQLDLLDRLVDFAEDNNMVVKGHGLISSCCNPDYVLNITDPIALRAAMTAHFEAFMHRYHKRMDRWDVVTEALETQGGGLNANIFYNVLGSGYIADAFRIARAAGPDAKLFINENLVESLPGKRQELYDLVSGLVADGIPIDGIVNSYTALGLEVTIAELDVHTLDNALETDIYGAVVGEALKAGITDISFWGFTDKHAYTWVPGAKPLMFDQCYKPKSEFYATHSALANFVSGP